MSKIFTITEGLENMGALKTGGQGSVYKARRTGEIISAVKLLPTPIHTESPDDRHFLDFQNEVAKLKKVNETPNPNVVKILSSGVTETGSFPFIEMEFIEGPDLQELLEPPHDNLFTIRESIKVAEDISSALAHCHRVGVTHGDIKTNNVKYNVHSAHYVLLDFGLALMSDEQRRTSLRQAGAIEFMAPEQIDGKIFFETDVYSFGVLMFELLSGTVPFPLADRSESSRNNVRLAHIESVVPDLLKLREENLPENWSEQKKRDEMQVPGWLVKTIYRCLEKKPSDRFNNGIELYNQVAFHRISSFADHDLAAKALGSIQKDNDKLRKEKKILEERLQNLEKNGGQAGSNTSPFTIVLILLVVLLGAAVFYFYKRDPLFGSRNTAENNQPVLPKKAIGQFTVAVARAYFHNEPDASTRRKAFMIPSKEIILGLEEKNGFIFTEFTNSRGQVSKGWLKKSDLIKANAASPATSDKNVLSPREVQMQLEDAEALLLNNSTDQALYIYKRLADQEVPEAMFQYGNLGLKKKVRDMPCTEAYEWVRKASATGYAPAKRTIGFLFMFADNEEVLKANEYDECTYERNVYNGTRLLKEAKVAGDSIAGVILDQVNLQP